MSYATSCLWILYAGVLHGVTFVPLSQGESQQPQLGNSDLWELHSVKSIAQVHNGLSWWIEPHSTSTLLSTKFTFHNICCFLCQYIWASTDIHGPAQWHCVLPSGCHIPNHPPWPDISPKALQISSRKRAIDLRSTMGHEAAAMAISKVFYYLPFPARVVLDCCAGCSSSRASCLPMGQNCWLGIGKIWVQIHPQPGTEWPWASH